MMKTNPKKIALALTGASGAPYFLRLLERLCKFPDLEVHLLASDGGRRVLLEECAVKINDLKSENLVVHSNQNIGASLASGSFKLHAMAVVPCSANTMSAIAMGITSNLIHRCAAVTLKEDRKLILAIRETPLSLVHLRAMTALKEAGAVVMPASPGFYHHPKTVTDLVDSVVDRVLDHLELDDPAIKRWSP